MIRKKFREELSNSVMRKLNLFAGNRAATISQEHNEIISKQNQAPYQRMQQEYLDHKKERGLTTNMEVAHLKP